jgi:hypothetical protein
MYDYREVIKEDIKTWIEENMETEEVRERIENDREGLAEELNESLWIEDSVTGNASGSYTFNTFKAEENLCHNMDLLEECASEFGGDVGEWIKKGAEYCDVSIRCFLLGECIESALDELEEE